MIKIGITGQSGFIGTHLFNSLKLFPELLKPVPFEDNYFEDSEKLESFVKSCNVIVHLAALNRHNSQDVIYSTNIDLVRKLISACETIGSCKHIIFSSSIQEERENLYGKSKIDGRELFKQWAERNHARFTGLIIPNVYGPFGKPFYNSFIATFCYQLTHNEQPIIETDGEVKLIYINELVEEFIKYITISEDIRVNNTVLVPHTSQIKVSEVLQLLVNYQKNYFKKGIIPSLDNPFERNLFNTFLCYIDHKSFFPFNLKMNTDNRGSFVETIKLNSGGQVSFSTTLPGITRGNHFHTRKVERFAVIKGKARIEIRKIGTDNILSFELNGEQPSFVDIPVWFSHSITNIGEDELYTIFWINEHFDQNNPDTIFEMVS